MVNQVQKLPHYPRGDQYCSPIHTYIKTVNTMYDVSIYTDSINMQTKYKFAD